MVLLLPPPILFPSLLKKRRMQLRGRIHHNSSRLARARRTVVCLQRPRRVEKGFICLGLGCASSRRRPRLWPGWPLPLRAKFLPPSLTLPLLGRAPLVALFLRHSRRGERRRGGGRSKGFGVTHRQSLRSFTAARQWPTAMRLDHRRLSPSLHLAAAILAMVVVQGQVTHGTLHAPFCSVTVVVPAAVVLSAAASKQLEVR